MPSKLILSLLSCLLWLHTPCGRGVGGLIGKLLKCSCGTNAQIAPMPQVAALDHVWTTVPCAMQTTHTSGATSHHHHGHG